MARLVGVVVAALAAVVIVGTISTNQTVAAPALTRQAACAEYQAVVQEVLAGARDEQLTGDNEESVPDPMREAQMRALFQGCIDELLAQLRSGDCATARAAVRELLGLERAAQLVGGTVPLPDERALQVDVAELCYAEAFDKCHSNHDPSQVLEMLAIQRELQLLGDERDIDRGRAEQCLTVELSFESQLEVVYPLELIWTYRTHVRSTVPLRPRVSEGTPPFALVGEAPLEYVSHMFEGDLPPCSLRIIGFSATEPVQVQELTFNLHVRTERDPGVTLSLVPGRTEEREEFRCQGVPTNIRPSLGGWDFFYLLRWELGEAMLNFGPLTMRDWSVGEGAVLAHKTFERTQTLSAGQRITERTRLEIKHTPRR